MEDIKNLLENLATSLESEDNAAMVAAFDKGPVVFKPVADALLNAAEALREGIKKLDDLENNDNTIDISNEDLEEIAATASAFDLASTMTEDGEWFAKQAKELDSLLFSFSSLQNQNSEFKKKYDKKLEELRINKRKNPYDMKMKNLYDADDMARRVNEQIKDYRIMEHPLSNRYCPDHTGYSVKRLEDGVFQCMLDNKIYNFNEGFTTMKGEKVPGGSVDENTKTMLENTNYQPNFSTREDKTS